MNTFFNQDSAIELALHDLQTSLRNGGYFQTGYFQTALSKIAQGHRVNRVELEALAESFFS